MATLNELAPKSADDHQGRLAHVPSNLLPKEIVGPIFDKAQETSLVMRVGEQIPVSYGETVIPTTTKRPEAGQVGTGTSNEQREGGRKPLSGTAWGSRAFSPIKLATIVTVSDEFVRTNPRGLYTQLLADLPRALGRAVDLAVFHGKSPLTGVGLLGIDTDNVIASTTNVKNLTRANLLDGLMDGHDLIGDDFEFSGWTADSRFKSALARASVYRDNNGNVDPARVNLSAGVSDILGYPVQYGRAVSGRIGEALDTGIKIIGGDFSQLRWGFADQIRIKVSDTASLTDGTDVVSMFQTNQVAILAEVTFGWILGDKEGFTKFSNVETSSFALDLNGASGGTFNLVIDGVATADIAYNASASTIKTAIVNLDDGIVAADVTVTGSAGDFTIAIPALVEIDATDLTGGTGATVSLIS